MTSLMQHCQVKTMFSFNFFEKKKKVASLRTKAPHGLHDGIFIFVIGPTVSAAIAAQVLSFKPFESHSAEMSSFSLILVKAFGKAKA